MHHVENPAYFNAPQTTYGVRRIGPIHQNPIQMNPVQRYNPMGTLSIDGKIIPAPIHSALSGITYGAPEDDGKPSVFMSTPAFIVYGILFGGLGYMGLRKMGVI